jgi:solute:Na+ symporter, SSS family
LNLSFVDWAIVIAFFAGLAFVTIYVNRYTKSVADFLVANRCAGKYLLCVSGGMSATGVISFIAVFEMYYKVGFVADWWIMLAWPLSLLMGISGWVTYRFRETRAMTMAQFLKFATAGVSEFIAEL